MDQGVWSVETNNVHGIMKCHGNRGYIPWPHPLTSRLEIVFKLILQVLSKQVAAAPGGRGEWWGDAVSGRLGLRCVVGVARWQLY